MRDIFVRSAYNYDSDAVSADTGLFCDPDEDMTKQEFSEDADINVIVERFGLTGEVPANFQMPVSGDFTGVSDFQTAMQLVRAAQEEFMRVPAALRERFNHDPQKLMAFVEDDANIDEARKLGLLKPLPEVTRDAVQAIDDLAKQIKAGPASS